MMAAMARADWIWSTALFNSERNADKEGSGR